MTTHAHGIFKGVVGIGLAGGLLYGLLYLAGCEGTKPHVPPSPPPRPCAEIVENLRTLWGFERNFAYRNKALAASIGELGDGTGIGENGFVLKPALWKARLDAPETAQKGTGAGGYRYGIFPALTETGERDRFSAILVAVPETPSADNVCFAALCGPVNLRNDFSFDQKWPVFQLRAEKAAVDALRNLGPTTLPALEDRLDSGDLHGFVVLRFGGLYYPK